MSYTIRDFLHSGRAEAQRPRTRPLQPAGARSTRQHGRPEKTRLRPRCFHGTPTDQDLSGADDTGRRSGSRGGGGGGKILNDKGVAAEALSVHFGPGDATAAGGTAAGSRQLRSRPLPRSAEKVHVLLHVRLHHFETEGGGARPRTPGPLGLRIQREEDESQGQLSF